MPDTKLCAECGSPLPDYWPKGLCAQCALDGALDMAQAESRMPQPKTLVITPADLKPPGSGPESSPLGSFGDYDLLDEIARGGMGVVYKARQRKLDPSAKALSGHIFFRFLEILRRILFWKGWKHRETQRNEAVPGAQHRPSGADPARGDGGGTAYRGSFQLRDFNMAGRVAGGLTGSALKPAIWRLRQRHRDLLREEIAHTVATPAGVDGEIRHLLSVLGG